MSYLKRFLIVSILLLVPVIGILFAENTVSKDDLIEDVPSRGAKNAIMKAYQMTDLEFTTLNDIHANPIKTYRAGEKYRGMIYSSVKETYGFVGLDVSMHTFMTALHNPKSVMYTEDVSKPPYHGKNCGAYYGTVCSAFVCYALGIKVYMKTYDYYSSPLMKLIDDQSSRGVRLADVIHSGGHVRLVTKIRRNIKTGKAVELEFCEGVGPGCRRVTISGNGLDRKIRKGKWKLYRYKNLEKNSYAQLTDFVAVEGEKPTPFKYNDVICTNRGDKSCFIVGDTVILNMSKGFNNVEVYKDGEHYKSIKTGENLDVILAGLPYGSYSAKANNGNKYSEATFWKVIDTNVSVNRKNYQVLFHSNNATPVYLEFCSVSGARGRQTTGIFKFSPDDIERGSIEVSRYVTKKSKKTIYKYVKVHFECDYGMVINKPINWFEQQTN